MHSKEWNGSQQLIISDRNAKPDLKVSSYFQHGAINEGSILAD